MEGARKRRFGLVLVVCAVVMTIGVAAGAGAQAKKQLVFGFVQPETEEWFTRNYSGFKAYCDQAGIKIAYMQPLKAGDPGELVNLVDELIGKGVDAIGTTPDDSRAQVVSAEASRRANIPFGTNGGTLDIPKFSVNDVDVKIIGDNFGPARNLGLYISKLLGGKGNLVVLMGVPGLSNSVDRDRGILQGAKEGGLTVLDDQPCNYNAQKAYSVMSDFLTKYPKIDAVFGGYDDGVLACYQAAKAVHREKEMLFFGFDGTKGTRDAIARKEITGTVDMNSYNMGWLLAMGLHHKVLDPNSQRMSVEVEFSICTHDNILQKYPEVRSIYVK